MIIFPLLAMVVDEATLQALAADITVLSLGLDVPTGIAACEHGTHVVGIAARVTPDA